MRDDAREPGATELDLDLVDAPDPTLPYALSAEELRM